MRLLKIPGKHRATKALRARYVEGWEDGSSGREHAYSTEYDAELFTRQNGAAQLSAYSAGYKAGVGARSEGGNEPPKPAGQTKLTTIPAQFMVTAALRARYLEGWRDGLAGRAHMYSAKFAADTFKRRYGSTHLEAYNAGYEAGARARAVD